MVSPREQTDGIPRVFDRFSPLMSEPLLLTLLDPSHPLRRRSYTRTLLLDCPRCIGEWHSARSSTNVHHRAKKRDNSQSGDISVISIFIPSDIFNRRYSFFVRNETSHSSRSNGEVSSSVAIASYQPLVIPPHSCNRWNHCRRIVSVFHVVRWRRYHCLCRRCSIDAQHQWCVDMHEHVTNQTVHEDTIGSDVHAIDWAWGCVRRS